jgi:ATP-dependent DNA ligase
VFQYACKMGLERIVSKRLGSRYRSGRSPDWLKFKNPESYRALSSARRTTARVRLPFGDLSSSRTVKWFVFTIGINGPGR